jgi:hypothetical protein
MMEVEVTTALVVLSAGGTGRFQLVFFLGGVARPHKRQYPTGESGSEKFTEYDEPDVLFDNNDWCTGWVVCSRRPT